MAESPSSWLTVGLAFVILMAAYSFVAARLDKRNVTGPMVFALAGLLIGPRVLQLVDLKLNAQTVGWAATITLALLLFSDASTIDLSALRRDAGVPLRLLLLGLPLTVILGTVLAGRILPLDLAQAAIVATVLAPTDLSLGLGLFNDQRVPIRVRREITVESGLNDGVAAPLVALAIALAVATEQGTGSAPLREAVVEIVIGVATGVAVGVAGGFALKLANRFSAATEHSRRFVAFALALASYAAAIGFHGNGFIAAFVGGLAFGAVCGREAQPAADFAEDVGTLMSLGVWFVFGIGVGPLLMGAHVTWQPIVFAILSLTVIRMVPVALALIGTRMQPRTVLLVGWFGPRGLASIVFFLQALRTLGDAGLDASVVSATVGWTVLFSVVAHGLSAGPLASWYGAKAALLPPNSPELEPGPDALGPRGLSTPPRRST